MKWLCGACILVMLLALPALGQEAPEKGTAPEKAASPLLNPKGPEMTQQAPAVYRARFETTKGPFVVEVTRKWAPLGADRFYNLVRNGYYNGDRFFRVIKGFMVQFGINGDPAVNDVWQEARIKDDPVVESNKRGNITFAKTSQPDSRTTQVFINYRDNANLDAMGFAPFGKVIDGMAVVDSLYGDYGEGAPRGSGPDQSRIQSEGNKYLETDFPKLDYIKTATIVEAPQASEKPAAKEPAKEAPTK